MTTNRGRTQDQHGGNSKRKKVEGIVTYEEALSKLVELHKELAPNPDITAVILIADTSSGSYRYMTTGFVEIQALLIKMLFQNQPALAATVITGGPTAPSA